MRLLVLFLFVPVLLFGQAGINESLWNSTSDSMASITKADSVYARLYSSPWVLLTKRVMSGATDTAYVTVSNKVQEATVVFRLADESWWTHTGSIQFQIRATNIDTLTSRRVSTSGLNGAFTLFLKPDTTGTNTWYNKSWIEGN